MDPLSSYMEVADAGMFPGIRKDTNKKPVVPPSYPQAQGRLSLMPSKELPQQYRSGKGWIQQRHKGPYLDLHFSVQRTGAGFLSHRC